MCLTYLTRNLSKAIPKPAFADRMGVVITERVASLIFGEEDPMGRVLTVDNATFGGDYIIRGVMKERRDPSTVRFGLINCADAKK